jgi:hypothetical protein
MLPVVANDSTIAFFERCLGINGVGFIKAQLLALVLRNTSQLVFA